ncbi:MAG: hypothetical protein V1800_03600, partial [Candidatus Latescibacterota bacterium]
MPKQTVASDRQEIETIPGTRMRVDWASLISGQDIVLENLPDNFRDGLRMGNGDIGVAVYAVPECLTLSVAKNDLLDYRMGDPWNPFVAMPSSKPAGSIRFRGSLPRNADCKARLDLWNAQISTGFEENPATELRTFVSKKRNLIVAEYNPAQGSYFDIEMARHQDSAGCIPDPPEFGATGRDIWVRYRFPPSPDTYPNGFEYVMYGRVSGGMVVSTEVVNEFATVAQFYWGQGDRPREVTEGIARVRMKASDPVTVLVAVVTTRDNQDPFQAAQAAVEAAERAGLPALRQEHSELWHAFWQRSFVQLRERYFLNQQWFLSQYHLACITRPESVLPGLFGPWTWEDFPAWGNDCHWDYNLQATLWGAYSSNHLELTCAYNEDAFKLLPFAKMRAKEYEEDFPGAFYALTTWPLDYNNFTKTPLPEEMDFINPWINGFVAHPLWWYYQYSQDTEFLRERGYPVIKACAQFYAHFVNRAPDGKYDMPPTGVWDLASIIKDPGNAVIDLAFAKMLLEDASAASKVLGLDADSRAQWIEIAENLRDYPTLILEGENLNPVDHKGVAVPLYTSRDFPSGEVLVVYENYPVIEYQAPAPIMPMFPSGDIGLDSPSGQRELAHRTLQITPYYLWDDLVMLSMAWVRLGYDQLDVFEKHSRDVQLVNGCLTLPKDTWPGKWIFTHFLGWPIVLNESIVQSHTGKIRVAPVKLTHPVQFARLRTVGAFLISGEMAPGGKVSYLAITSEAGSPCHLVRPWEGEVRPRVREVDSMK